MTSSFTSPATFVERDWGSAERLAESLRAVGSDVEIRMIDCAAQPSPNLGITDLSPAQDVWVAGVPVVVSVTVQNYSQTEAKNVVPGLPRDSLLRRMSNLLIQPCNSAAKWSHFPI